MMKVEYFGSFGDPSGYGRIAREYVTGLLEYDKVDIKISPIDFFQGHSEKFTSTHIDLLEKQFVPDITIQHYTPNYFKRKKGYNVGYTVWELPLIPRGWGRRCNILDEIWTPSNFSKKAFMEGGAENVFLIPHGIELDKYSPEAEPTIIENKAGFNFLSIAQWNYRKGLDILVNAYLREFNSDENVGLILKTFGIDNSGIEKNRVRSEIYKMQKRVLGGKRGPKILYISEFIDTIEGLYTTSDCFVLPVRGGGFEMCFLEALACGLPVIGTRCGGQADYLNEKNALIVDSSKEVYCSNMESFTFYDDEMIWFEPDENDLREKMRKIFEDSKVRDKLSSVARDSIKEYDLSKICKKIVNRLEEIYGICSNLD